MQTVKKSVAGLMAGLVVLSLMLMAPLPSRAAGDSMSTADNYTLGQTVSGSLTATNAKDIYRFTLPESGRVTLNVTAYIHITSYYFYDSNGNTVWEAQYQYWNDTSEVLMRNENIDLTSGTYYFCIEQRSGTGNYHFTMNFTSAGESFHETSGGTNNSMKDASAMSLKTLYHGQIAHNDKKDLYQFILPESGRVTLNVTAYIYLTYYYIYDSNGDTVWKAQYQYWNGTSEVLMLNENIDLTSGTYYFCIEQGSGTGNYTFKMDFTSSGESFQETTGGVNNTMKDAVSITLGTPYYGQIARNDTKDFYTFNLAKSEKITLNITAYINKTNYYIYDAKGDTVWKAQYQYWNDTSEVYTRKETIDLSAGAYYFCVENNGTGNYSFQLSDRSGPVYLGRGDIDGNGSVSAEDALLALQAATSKIKLSAAQIPVADVDGKDGVTSTDALLILQYATRKINTL